MSNESVGQDSISTLETNYSIGVPSNDAWRNASLNSFHTAYRSATIRGQFSRSRRRGSLNSSKANDSLRDDATILSYQSAKTSISESMARVPKKMYYEQLSAVPRKPIWMFLQEHSLSIGCAISVLYLMLSQSWVRQCFDSFTSWVGIGLGLWALLHKNQKFQEFMETFLLIAERPAIWARAVLEM